VQEFLEVGIDMHVSKPIELPRLQAALEAAMALNDAAARKDGSRTQAPAAAA
jgi:CheY-like chemotaxis protein